MSPGAPTDPFHSTLWSAILHARNPADPHCRSAMAVLCSSYWEPIYAYLRRRGLSPEDARDRTQGFFAYFLEKGLLEQVDPRRGRFRAYLLAVLQNFLRNERRIREARKRGGGLWFHSLDVSRVERDWEPESPETPEAAYRRLWALQILSRAFDAVRADLARRHPGIPFDALCAHEGAAGPKVPLEDLAARLGLTPVGLKNLLFWFRRRLREAVRSLLLETVDSEQEVEREIQDLFQSLG